MVNSYYICAIHYTGQTVLDIHTFPNNEKGKAECLERAKVVRCLLSIPKPEKGKDNEELRTFGQSLRTRLKLPNCVVRVEAIHYHQLQEAA